MKWWIAVMVSVAALWAGAAHGEREAPKPSDEDKIAQPLVDEALPLVRGRRFADAVAKLDQAIGVYERGYKADKTQYFCARTTTETLFYLLQVANAKDGSSAVVLSMNWASALYIKAYALIELGRVQEAKASLLKAVTLSPRNSHFLSELGHVYQLEKDWAQSLQTYERAEEAKEFSPPDRQDAELARAWRGKGYAYAELGRLDEAEAVYLKCLALNKNDAAATRELQYVRDLKAKQPAKSAAATGGGASAASGQ